MHEWHDLLKERLAGLDVRPEREAEILDELSQHLDDAVRELVAGGLSLADARAAARADLEAPGALARRLADIETRAPLVLPPPGAPARGRWLHARTQDIRHSFRALRRSPIFACTVVVTLALTIGPTTAILSIGNWLVWRPVPGVRDQDRLATAQTGIWSERGVNITSVSYANLQDLRAASKTLTAIAGVQESNAHLAGDTLPPTDARAGAVTANALEALGVQLVAGRYFGPDDDREQVGDPVVIIRNAVAIRGFGGADNALGKRILLNGLPLTVVGVVPDRFLGITPLSRVDVWYPGAWYGYVNHFSDSSRLSARGGGLFNSFVVRLAAGATVEAAQAELDVLFPALAERYPDVNGQYKTMRARLTAGLGAEVRERYSRTVTVLLAIGTALLILGCANVANVLMMRAVRMGRDRAIRLALGASRTRLAALQLTESALLALSGAAAGVLLALWLKQVIVWLLFPGLPPGFDLDAPVDGRVLLMTLAVSVTCGLLAGFIPAYVSRKAAPGAVIATGGRATTPTHWLRGGLAAVQLALSLALVTGSLLLVSSLRQLQGADLGFDPSQASRHIVDPSRHGYQPDRTSAYFRDLLGRLQGRTGVEAVALSGLSPFGSSYGVRVQDPAGADRPPIRAFSNNVTADYFDVLRLRLVRGRSFTDAEGLAPADGAYPVVVDEGLARRLFGEADPIGRVVVLTATAANPTRALPVIGVAASTQWNNITGERPLFLYQPFAAAPRFSSMVLVRSPLPILAVTRTVQATAREIDPTLPVRLSQPISGLVDSELTNERVFAWMLSLLGVLAFTLAAVGLYGLLAQLVAERTREFGVRMAIGSGRARIFGLVLRQAAWIAAVGTVAGLVLAGFGTRLIEAQLYGVTRLDPPTYLIAAAGLAAVVFLAALWPARSATRIEPTEALKVE